MTIDNDIIFDEGDPDRWQKLVIQSLGGKATDTLNTMTEDGIALAPLYTADNAPAPIVIGANSGWREAQFCTDQGGRAAIAESVAVEAEGGCFMVMIPREAAAMINEDMFAPASPRGPAAIGMMHDVNWAKNAAMVDAGRKTLADKNTEADAPSVHLGADPVADFLQGAISANACHDEGRKLARRVEKTLSADSVFAASGESFHRLGLTDGEELAVMLADTVWQLRQCEAIGVAANTAMDAIVPRVAVGCDFAMAIAKTRASRLVWQNFAAACAVEHHPMIHVLTSDRMLTCIEPATNILRNVTAALGAALGGADLITCLPHDWLGGTCNKSRRLARNIHHLMRHEARLDQIADPAHGAYFLDHLTDQLARCAWDKFKLIESEGGIIAAGQSGLIYNWAKAAIAARQEKADTADAPILGLTVYPSSALSMPAPLIADQYGPRGGNARPAAVWESLRARLAAKPIRCLALQGKGELAGRDQTALFAAAGFTVAKITATDSHDAMRHITSTKPDVVVLSGWGSEVRDLIHAIKKDTPPDVLAPHVINGEVENITRPRIETIIEGKR